MSEEFQTYSLDQVGQWLCGDDLREPAVWVYRRILDGTFSGIKVGGKYRMTHQQVSDALAALAAPSVPRGDVLTAGSRRRRRA